MKRFVALVGVMLLVIGLRLYNNGLINCGYEGELSVGTFDTVQADKPLLIDGPHRMDIVGDEGTVTEILNNLSATKLWEERIDETTIIYAHSPRLSQDVTVHGKEVNLMIAITDNRIAAGTPLLYGSY